MPVDYTRFPFPGIENPHAASLLDALAYSPVQEGFVVILIKVSDGGDYLGQVRAFARALRADAARSGFIEITAYRHIRADEMGGAMPFDQAICEEMLRNAERHLAEEPDKFPALKAAIAVAEGENKAADWALMIEFTTTGQALAAANAWKGEDEAFAVLVQGTGSNSVNAFRNAKRYAHVSRDPNVIQFFNLFPGPGASDDLWLAWLDAVPWFLEMGEFRSSFPLIALDPDQSMILMNYAHIDSVKHFFAGAFYDPTYLRTIKTCYSDRGFALPLPFFCKIVPV